MLGDGSGVNLGPLLVYLLHLSLSRLSGLAFEACHLVLGGTTQKAGRGLFGRRGQGVELGHRRRHKSGGEARARTEIFFMAGTSGYFAHLDNVHHGTDIAKD